MTTTISANAIIPLPRLVLRVAFAGNRVLPDEAPVNSALRSIWTALGQRLAEIAPSVPITAGKEPPVSGYFSTERPLLRLITGLAEGADNIAWQTLHEVSSDTELTFAPHLDTELAAVLPCSLMDYRSDRETNFLPVFDTQATQCAYVVELDGIMTKDGSDLSKERRARGFRAQSAVLLRQADFLVAVADPAAAGKPGGTLETMRNALDFDLPVIFVHAVTGEIRLLDAIEDLAAAFASTPTIPWQTTLRDWTTKVIADPDTVTPDKPAHAGQPAEPNKGQLTLQEFFYAATAPPMDSSGKRRITYHEKCWSRFVGLFKSNTKQIAQPEAPPYKSWRTRAKQLNYHYSGQYRGTFFLNALRAFLAILCAALTLVLLGKQHSPQASTVLEFVDKIAPHSASGALPAPVTVANPVENSGHPTVVTASPPSLPKQGSSEPTKTPILPLSTKSHSNTHDSAHSGLSLELILSLLVLALFKLYLVFSIYRNTHAANHGGWNEKAVDYRYLAERLRALYCLPLLGSYQPPAASRPQYSSRIARQSAIDWLFDAIIRSHSPAESPQVQSQAFTTGDGKQHFIPTLATQPLSALASCSQWIESQVAYHDKSREVMLKMHHWAEKWGGRLGMFVIAIVSFDILALILDVLKLLPDSISHT